MRSFTTGSGTLILSRWSLLVQLLVLTGFQWKDPGVWVGGYRNPGYIEGQELGTGRKEGLLHNIFRTVPGATVKGA